MADIVQRLRDQGVDAFARHYSLGMFKLCAEAADEIDRLRDIARRTAELPYFKNERVKELVWDAKAALGDKRFELPPTIGKGKV